MPSRQGTTIIGSLDLGTVPTDMIATLSFLELDNTAAGISTLDIQDIFTPTKSDTNSAPVAQTESRKKIILAASELVTLGKNNLGDEIEIIGKLNIVSDRAGVEVTAGFTLK